MWGKEGTTQKNLLAKHTYRGLTRLFFLQRCSFVGTLACCMSACLQLASLSSFVKTGFLQNFVTFCFIFLSFLFPKMDDFKRKQSPSNTVPNAFKHAQKMHLQVHLKIACYTTVHVDSRVDIFFTIYSVKVFQHSSTFLQRCVNVS